MTTINDILKRLKEEKIRFTYDGDSIINIIFGLLSVSMFIEFDDDDPNRPLVIQYDVMYEDEDGESENMYIHEDYDEYDSKTKTYKDLDLDKIFNYLHGIIEQSKSLNNALTKIDSLIDKIVEIIKENEVSEDIVMSMISKKINFY